jgi:hypothetical protein
MLAPETTMRRWWLLSDANDKKTLAKASGTSVNHLRHLASGRRGISAELAQRLAKGSQVFKQTALVLDQRDLCVACGNCPLIKPKRG